MSDELRDYTTPQGWTLADADALRDVWSDDIAFLPPNPAEAERRRAQVEALGTSITWDDILAMYQSMLAPHPMLPSDPRAWMDAPVLSTEQPFPIRYAATVWEQLHPIADILRRPAATHYLPNPRSNHHRHPRKP